MELLTSVYTPALVLTLLVYGVLFVASRIRKGNRVVNGAKALLDQPCALVCPGCGTRTVPSVCGRHGECLACSTCGYCDHATTVRKCG